jgi:UDP-glucose 4-epimerase
VVVTGGAGFLGSHVVRQLLDAGRRVVVLDDFSNGKRMHLEGLESRGSLRVIAGDIVRIDDVRRAFAGCRTAIHLAVLDLRQSIRDPRRVNTVIVDGTLNCLDVAREAGMDLFVNCSSSEAYGTAHRVPMDEDHPLNPETPYAAAKVAQDMYVGSYGRTYGLPWVTVRPFNMYGPNSHWQGARGELIPKMIVRAMNGKPLILFGSGEQTRDFVYVEDAARAILAVAASDKGRGRCFNISTGVDTSVRRIAELICAGFGLDPAAAIQTQPGRPGDVMRHCGDGTRLRETFGFVPGTRIEEGLRRTAEWFRSLPFTPRQLLEQEVLRNWE